MGKIFKYYFLLLFLALPSYGGEKNFIEGFASFWFLPKGEIVPVPLKIDIPVKMEIYFSQDPGFVSIKKSTFSFEGEVKIQAELSVLSVCEHNDNDCLRSYFSAQVRLSGDTQSFCGAYFSKSDFFPMPVFFCSGPHRDGFLGITFHRSKFSQ